MKCSCKNPSVDKTIRTTKEDAIILGTKEKVEIEIEEKECQVCEKSYRYHPSSRQVLS